MSYIIGKYKSSIFSSDTGYTVGLFRVQKASDDLTSLVKKTVTFTGTFISLNSEELLKFEGEYKNHEKYGYQFVVESYSKEEPVGNDAIVEFLASSFIKGCGEKTAQKIVDKLGDKALTIIKEDKQSLLDCGLSERTATTIYNSILAYYDADESIMYLKGIGFNDTEITKIINLYGSKKVQTIIEKNLYSLVDFIPFSKLDTIFFNIYDETNEMRIFASIIDSLKNLSFTLGDTYSYSNEIYDILIKDYNIDVGDLLDDYLDKLKLAGSIIIEGDKIYLTEYYSDELYIANALTKINNMGINNINNIDYLLDETQTYYQIDYNKEQKKAIKESLKNPLTIITGGPGTGKTTIIKGILNAYIGYYNISNKEALNKIALLAPTGRAAKRMSEATRFPASTIHRYLKWNKDKNEFAINEYNKLEPSLVIIDEVSMIDTALLASFLRGIYHHAKIILVGDEFQLPSVGSGNILRDLIVSDVFPFIKLNDIYRQSDNSYIPILANDIKNINIDEFLMEKRDDYNFIKCEKDNIKINLVYIIERYISKGLTDKDIQVLIPMYKGENGIDNINPILQNLFNPASKNKKEVLIGPTLYREGDKVINLVNDIDNNIFNGDIGYIESINLNKPQEFMTINFYDNLVTIKRDKLNSIKHAYAMTIHKSQGSEFEHVIMPISKEYFRMLYNKLLYTGVSRAKKSLILLGDIDCFVYGIKNNNSSIRKTSLLDFIMNNYK